MEEKILIKSEKLKAERTLKAIMIAAFGMFVAILNYMILVKPDCKVYYSFYGYSGYETVQLSNGFEAAFSYNKDLYLILFFVMCAFFLAGIVTLIIYLVNRKCELVVTDKNVRGKTLFGKEVVLPLYMVSAYSTRKFMSTIAVATSSGLTKFTLIGNYNEIGNVLSGLINERQSNTTTAQTATPEQSAPAPQSNSMDDLVKLKSLLDSGIITQEEFDAKKKQLLGL